MSKLFKTYSELKKQDPETIYLFKSGIFFIALEDDAHKLSQTFNLKLGNLNNEIVKCGFPCSSIEKYSNLFKSHNITTKIIESDKAAPQSYSINEYKQSEDIVKLLDFILSVDTNNLSISEAYQFIDDVKSQVSSIERNDIKDET